MSNTIHIEGRLRHHFWGTYAATIALDCGSPRGAEDALQALGPLWKAGNVEGCIVYHGAGDELEGVLDTLASKGADRKKITSIAKSIDVGEPFEFTLTVVPTEQLVLFG